MPSVHSSVWVWVVPGYITDRKDKRALHTVEFRHLAFAFSVTLALYHQYLFSWQLKCIVFANPFVSPWIWMHFLVDKMCVGKKLMLAAGVLQDHLLILSFFYSSLHVADNSEILFSLPPLFSYTSHCSDIYDCIRNKKKLHSPEWLINSCFLNAYSIWTIFWCFSASRQVLIQMWIHCSSCVRVKNSLC